MGLGDIVTYDCVLCGMEFAPEKLNEDYCPRCERNQDGKGSSPTERNSTKET